MQFITKLDRRFDYDCPGGDYDVVNFIAEDGRVKLTIHTEDFANIDARINDGLEADEIIDDDNCEWVFWQGASSRGWYARCEDDRRLLDVDRKVIEAFVAKHDIRGLNN